MRSLLTYASGWIDGSESVIYDAGAIDARRSAALEVLQVIWGQIKGLSSDLLGAMFSDMLRSLGDSLYYMLSMAGIDLNAVVYGRVGGASSMNSGVALFTFELVPGNPYGIVALFIYGHLRMICILIIICILLAMLTAYLYSFGNGRQRDRLKEILSYSLILISSVFLMPYMLGVILYLRDVLLYVVMMRGGDLVTTVSESIYPDFISMLSINRIQADIIYSFLGSAGEYNIVTMFRNAAGGNFLNSLMYIGAVCMTLYFAFSYISAALTQLVLVVSFPFASIATMFDRSIMKNWIKQLLGVVMIPVIDSFLLILPIIFGLFGKSQAVSGYTLVQLILCSSIIPARGVLRSWMGLGSASGMELAGLGTLVGAMQLAKTIAGVAVAMGTGNLAAGAAAMADSSMADMFAEKQEAKQLSDIGEMNQLNEDVGDLLGIQNQDSFNEKTGENMESAAQSLNGNKNHMDQGLEMKDKISQLDHRKVILSDQMKQNDVHMAEIARDSAAIDEDIAVLRADKEAAKSMGPQGQGRMEECDRLIAENELSKKSLAAKTAGIRKDNSVKAGQIARIDSVTRRAKDTMVSLRAAGSGSIGGGSEEQEILDRYANIENFETPEFKNMSMQRKSELYRERASATRKRAQMQNVLAASGAVVGGTAAFGATMFGSPAVKMYGLASGIQAGSGFGNIVSDYTISKERMAAYQPNVSAANTREETLHVTQASAQITEKRTEQIRITKKQDVEQSVIEDRQTAGSTSYDASGERRYGEYQGFDASQNKWTYGTENPREHVWNQIISAPEGQERVSVELRRALNVASANVRIMRKNLDGEFSMSNGEKNEQIMDNAMDALASEFSYNLINNGALSDEMRYEGFDADAYLDFLNEKVRTDAKDILKDKLQSLGLFY